ncbi:hypothetical protein V8C44DRAFT_353573 [Trichoderma aethiopicum]
MDQTLRYLDRYETASEGPDRESCYIPTYLRQASPDTETHPILVFRDVKWRHGALRFADVEVSFVYPQMESREGFRPVLSSAGSGQDHACGANRGPSSGSDRGGFLVLCLHYPTAFVRLLTTCQEIVLHDGKHVSCNCISFDSGIWKMALRLIRLTKRGESRC